jgi:hypothetical protein
LSFLSSRASAAQAFTAKHDCDAVTRTVGPDVSFEAARHSDEAMIAAAVDFGVTLLLDDSAPDPGELKTKNAFVRHCLLRRHLVVY